MTERFRRWMPRILRRKREPALAPALFLYSPMNHEKRYHKKRFMYGEAFRSPAMAGMG